MINIDNRPQRIATAQAYRENDLILEVTVLPEIVLAGISVSVELKSNSGKKLYDVTTFEIEDQIIIISFTRQQVKKFPNIAHCLVSFDGVYQYGYEVEANFGYGIPTNTAATVGLYLKGEKGEPGAPGELTPEAAILAAEIRADRVGVEAKANQVGLDRDLVLGAKEEVLEAADLINGISARKVDGWEVDTLAEAQAFSLTLTRPAIIYVVADESQGGIRATYSWDKQSLQEILLL